MPVLAFINYRTGDGDQAAMLVDHELSRRFGKQHVFLGSRSIPPAADYEVELLRAVRRSSVLLALIGPRWLAATGPDGEPALECESDWIRREIVEAFAFGVPVLPVMLGTTPVLKPADLPAELRQLAMCQYRRLDIEDADSGLNRLADAVRVLAPEPASPPVPEPADGAASKYSITARGDSHVFDGNEFNGPVQIGRHRRADA